MFFEIYEADMTKCANEGGSCSISTCPAGRNMYYGVDDGSGNLDWETDHYKKYLTISDYSSGSSPTFTCNPANMDSVDPAYG